MRILLRRGKVLLVLAFALALALPGAALAQDSGTIEIKPGDKLPNFVPEEGNEAVPGQIIVKFKKDVGLPTQANIRRGEGLEKKADLDLIDAEVDQVKGQSVERAIRNLNARPNVEYAEPNGLLYPTGYADEPYFGYLWGLHNTGQTIGGYPGKSNVDINGKETSTVTQGNSNLVVAVIDDGVDFSHPDLSARAWKNPGESGSGKETNGIDDDGNGYVDDVNGWDVCHNDKTVHDEGDDSHGTHVAGTIAASINGQGIVGVAPNVKVMGVKFLSDTGTGTFCNSYAGAIEAIEYAKEKGIQISNNSWGGYSNNQSLKDAIDKSGSLFVAAAGNDSNDNDGTTPMYPASYGSANILSVAAVHNEGDLSWFSNYGATSVDISAPGEDILSSVPGGSWEFWSGTSMASPHVTGAAALVGSVNSGLLSKPVDLKKLIMNTGKPLSATSGDTVTGDMVDAKAAVDSAAPPDTTPPNTTVTSGPSGTLKSTSASFGFSSSEAGSKFECKLDGGSWQSCSSPKSYSGLSNDAHTFYVKAIDGAGNVDATPATRSWTVDTTAPNTTITSGPSGTLKSTSASFGFSSSEAGSKFQCNLDGSALGACASPKSYSGLSNGRHTFRVRAIDAVGNVDATPAVRAWTVDTIKPAISGVSPKPKSKIKDRTPTIKAKVKDNSTNLKKKNIKLYVNGKRISPKKWSYSASTDLLRYDSPKVPKGKKTIKIVATDTAKNVGAKSWSFTIK